MSDKCERYEKLLRRVLEWCEADSPDFEIDADAIRATLADKCTAGGALHAPRPINYELFHHMSETYGMELVDSELHEIEAAVARGLAAPAGSPLGAWLKKAKKAESHQAAKRICSQCGGPGAHWQTGVCAPCEQLAEIQAANTKVSDRDAGEQQDPAAKPGSLR